MPPRGLRSLSERAAWRTAEAALTVQLHRAHGFAGALRRLPPLVVLRLRLRELLVVAGRLWCIVVVAAVRVLVPRLEAMAVVLLVRLQVASVGAIVV